MFKKIDTQKRKFCKLVCSCIKKRANTDMHAGNKRNFESNKITFYGTNTTCELFDCSAN